MAQQALGMIETQGLVTGLAAADAAAKAAAVEVLRRHHPGRGLVTILIEGEVAAVRAAVEAGAAEGRRVGTVVSVHVIPRPADGLETVTAAKQSKPARRTRRNAKSAGETGDSGG